VFFPFDPKGTPDAFLDYQTITLEKFGIAAHRVTILEAPTAFEEIHVPEPLYTINHRANIHLANIYRRFATFYAQDGRSRRIFLSRLQPYTRVANVTAVEEVFRELDFEMVYPETLDLPAQLALYANCSVMAGFAGTALHNCLYCREGTALIELGDTRSRDEPLRTQRIVNQATGVEAHFIAYDGSESGVMDTAALRVALRALPLLGRSVPPYLKDGDFMARNMADHYPWPATLTAHVSGVGDVFRTGYLEIGGQATGRTAIEGFSIALERTAPFGLEYKALLQDGTWTAWSTPGLFVGSRGMSKPIRGYAVRLDAAAEGRFRCVCLGRFAGEDGIVEAADGALCESASGGNLRGLQIQLRRA
jgi:hypothetical protein